MRPSGYNHDPILMFVGYVAVWPPYVMRRPDSYMCTRTLVYPNHGWSIDTVLLGGWNRLLQPAHILTDWPDDNDFDLCIYHNQ